MSCVCKLSDREQRGAGWRHASDGSDVWCVHSRVAVHDDAGRVSGFAEVFHAAGDGQPVSHALAGESETSRSQNTPIVVFEQDRDLRYCWLSAPPGPLGIDDAEDVLGRTEEEVAPPSVRRRVVEQKRAVLDTGQPVIFDIPYRRNGDRYITTITAGPLRDAEGNIVGIRGVAVDTTDQVVAYERLRESCKRLAEAEAVGRMGSWEYDLRDDALSWSEGSSAILGRSPELLPSRLELATGYVHPDDRDRASEALRRVLSTGEGYEHEFRIVRGDGRVRLVHSRVEAIMDGERSPARLVGTLRDITEADGTARTLQSAADELARRAAELRERVRTGGPIRRVTEDDPLRLLSPRQREILSLVAQGHSNLQIANELFLTENTVKWHIVRIFNALQASNRAQATAIYLGATAP